MRFASFLFLVLFAGPLSQAQNLAIVDATVYFNPKSDPQKHATVLVLNGRVSAVGSKLQLPVGTPVLPCKSCVVFAGFWNCHVHFTGDQMEQLRYYPICRAH